MTTPPPLTRDMLELVFQPEELVTTPESALDGVTHPDTRHVLATLGIPVRDNPWFDMAEGLDQRLRPVGDWDWDLSDRYEQVPPGAERWISLALIPYDDIAFDPSTGTVWCLPQDADIRLMNSSLRSFVHFLYILETERPHYDFQMEDSDAEFEPEASQDRTKEAMREVDPAALDNPQSSWYKVLTYMVDPEHHF
ncbi:hypothetical protein FOPG_20072 [Fusarium oxysporum f. sp. conglutinans race 2 54008]|uniref:Uncharacterized protein n=6 Tax=Fusarium oxysporum TaxID=5507 RepID=A0A8H6LR50_FUSOX|nr:hypothetical protein FOXG_15890 [Fusarium oxysporum f. sp. lycopersici 4287]EGU72900.1 hypothetical protein FOXB_16591 [Fusarium oxysporum f. sp. conglutinans Fo5176]EXK26731.1 hypothetical protein FOMG_16677 [Fusarium oxysporum f. sp. melonis 26406]EXL63655.1 hypothetical protein FOPG_20072 [Fusarium oxysporum f. sp. conglutinans race 2 54008]KAF6527720.1 hypothetical protein HZS61_008022 [Fusarium oxysporum f. sp. conglutinans]KAI8417185.1 hypothetical protein FOFC_03498 [Fusarium oxyspor